MVNSKKNPEEAFKIEMIYPIIVYALIKGNISKIKSNIVFLQLFRHKSRLESEEDFYINAMMVAIQIIENMTYKKLNIDKNEFLKKCEESENTIDLSNENYVKPEQIKNEQVLQQPANSDKTIFGLELNKLYNEYFTNSDLKDMPLFKLENMYKDFKIIISMISDFKSNENASAQIIKSKSENEMKKTSSNNNNLIEI